MEKAEVVQVMLEQFISDNESMAKQSGMPEEEIKELSEKSVPGIQYILANVYDKLVEKEIIK